MTDASFFARQFLASVLAGLTAAATFLLVGNGGGIPWFPPAVVFPLVGLALLAGLGWPLWQYWRHLATSTAAYHGLVLGIRYLTAFNLACFGWKKAFGLQFLVPPAVTAQPIQHLSGEWLTWFYFGYSPTFGWVLAGLQLLGAGLLLFERTVLLGALLLSAVLLPLTLINLCYHLNAGALVQSLVATAAVLFLLSLHAQLLRGLVLPAASAPSAHSASRQAGRLLLKLAVLLLAGLFTFYLRWYLGRGNTGH